MKKKNFEFQCFYHNCKAIIPEEFVLQTKNPQVKKLYENVMGFKKPFEQKCSNKQCPGHFLKKGIPLICEICGPRAWDMTATEKPLTSPWFLEMVDDWYPLFAFVLSGILCSFNESFPSIVLVYFFFMFLQYMFFFDPRRLRS